MKNIAILGSTGSIGRQALDVVRQHSSEFNVTSIVAHSSVHKLVEQAKEFSPKIVGLVNDSHYKLLKEELPNTEIVVGKEALFVGSEDSETDVLLTAIVGAVGIEPTARAIKNGKDIALANKETLVACGSLITQLCQENNTSLYPVDSEHSAIYQCLEGQKRENVDKLIITASGGPLRRWAKEDLAKATPEDCLKHPTWSMGNKITIDSSTLFNKGLEVIEAHWLFGFDYDDIDVVVHPQSIVHSMIKMKDGAVLAQMGTPDMREPIQYALTAPNRRDLNMQHLDFTKAMTLEFIPPRYEDFPALKLAYEVGRKDGFYPAIFNAANEVAVYAFLDHRIGFNDIYKTVRHVVDQNFDQVEFNLENVLKIDQIARQMAQQYIEQEAK